MLNGDDHDALVGRLYASALGEAPWAAMLEDLAGRFGTSASVFHIEDSAQRTTWAESYGYSPEFAAQFYASEIFARDPRVPFIKRTPKGSIYYDHALYDVEEMERNPFCRATVDALNLKYQLGARVGLADGATGHFAVLSTEADGHPPEAVVRAFRRLAPHIQQALSLGQVVEQRTTTQAILLDALAHRADGVILLGRSGAPVFMNDPARAILSAGDGLAYSQGSFVTSRGPETRRLHSLIGQVIAVAPPSEAQPGGEMLVSRTSGRRPYLVRVMPVPKMECFLARNSVACAIHLNDLATVRLPSRSLLSAAYGLSEREIDLAVEMARCADLDAAAGAARMAFNTARNHLHGIFRKTGTRNQAEAIQLLGRLA